MKARPVCRLCLRTFRPTGREQVCAPCFTFRARRAIRERSRRYKARKYVPPGPRTRTCVDCGIEYQNPVKRGRPFVRCVRCR